MQISRIVLLCAALLAGCGPVEPVKLGFIAGQTGPFSDLGLAGLNGAVLAVEQRNEAGGVGGRPVRLLIQDDEHDGAKAKAAFRNLVRDGVVAVIGPMTSAMATELLPEADRARIVLMGGTVVTNKVSGKDDFFFRAIAATARYAAYSAKVHAERLHPKRVSVVFDAANRDYAEDWARDYAAEMARLGAAGTTIVEIDSRAPQETPAIAAKLLAAAPDLIVFACSARCAGSLMRTLRAKNAGVRFATSAWAANRLLPEIGMEAAEGAYVEQYHDLGDPSAGYRRFVEAYRKRFNQPVDYAAVIAFDATNIVLDALERNPGRDGLKETLLHQASFKGLQAGITFDTKGDATRPAFTTIVRNGRFEPLP